MSQLVTDKTAKPLTDKSHIRPHDKVKVKFPAGKHHKKETIEELHPLFAVKMVNSLRAEWVDEHEGKKWDKLYGDVAGVIESGETETAIDTGDAGAEGGKKKSEKVVNEK
jgi:hypothetical protein